MSEDVFTQTEGDKTGSALEQLVGEDKKFKTVEDLAKGKLQADAHIEQLEGETKLVRDKLAELEGADEKEATVAELLKAVREHQKVQGDEEGDKLSDEDLSKKIREVMQGETEAQTRAKNRGKANQAVLDKMNGDVEAARIYLAERAKQLGMSPEALAELGETSPEAFTKLVEVEQSTGSQGITGLPGGADTGASLGTDKPMEIDGHKTKAYYDKLKASLTPLEYWTDPKLQGQYYKDAMALGDRFNQ
jgi:hypothetical protein